MSKDTLEKIFEERFWVYGEVLNEDSLPESIRPLYEIPIHYLNSALQTARTPVGNSFPFLVRYIANGSFNAAACDAEEGALICIHSSVPILLFMACVSYATRCDIQYALPKRQGELLVAYDDKISLPGRLNDLDLTSSNMARIIDEFCESILSIDGGSEAFHYGLFLYEIAIRFVAMHECMHIILGHTAYVKKHLGMDVLVEFSAQREQQLQQNFSHALEFLADRNTACGILTQTLNGNTIHPYGHQLPEFADIDFHTFVIRSVIQAFCLLLHLLPYKLDGNLGESLVKTHPHPYVRMQWMNREMGHQVIGEKEKFTKKIVYPFAYASGALMRNFITPNSWIYANEEDVKAEDRMFSDLSYEDVSKNAKNLQAKLWSLAPRYEKATQD